MDQLSLDIAPRLPYTAQNFIVHDGVHAVLESTRTLLSKSGFQLCMIEGERKSGKTHFSIRLADELLQLNRIPRLYEADAEGEFLREIQHSFESEDEVFIVDDADRYLATLVPGGSGEFVKAVEFLRVRACGMVLISGTPLKDFHFDEHVKSRLQPGAGLVIGYPSPEDIGPLIRAMAYQRGMRLSERKIDFLSRRLGRQIAALDQYFQRVEELSRVTQKPARLSVLGGAL